MLYLWITLAVLFLVVEFSTVALVSVWFVGGSLAALIASLLGQALWVQLLLFGVVSLLLLLLARPFLNRFVEPNKVKTNVDALVGKEALVVERVDNIRETGAVKLEGKVWTARSANGMPLEPETLVRVKAIEGVKAVVVPIYRD